MALATDFSNQRVSVGYCPSKASRVRASSPAPYQHQTRGRDVVRASTPAAVNQLQACELGRGDVSPVLSRISHWSLLLATDRRKLTSRSHRLNSPAARHCAERGAFILSSANGSRRSRARTLAHQQTVNVSADPLHSQAVLFAGCSVREVSSATKGLGNVRKVFGEIRNV
jgi:hypothetical protein